MTNYLPTPLSISLGYSNSLTLQYKQARNEEKKISYQIKQQTPTTDKLNLLDNFPRSENTKIEFNQRKLPPAWVDIFDQVQEDMHRLKGQLKILKNLEIDRLKSTFSNTEKQDQEINRASDEITELIKQCELRIKQIGYMSGNDSNIRQNIQKLLVQELRNLALNFRKFQKQFLDNISQIENQGKGAQLQFINPKEQEEVMQELGGRFDIIQLQAQDKSQEIQKIVKNINDLAIVFQDLQSLIIDQGTVLDCIDYNIEQAMINTENANKALLQYKKKNANKSMRAIYLMSFLIILIGIFSTLLVFKHT